MLLLVFSGAVFAQVAAECKAQHIDAQVVIRSVVDGDTVRLQDGQLLRLIGVNSPEIDHQGGQSEPYALAARDQLREMLKGHLRVGLQYGKEAHDVHGRLLAHLFTDDGRNAQAELLAQGLAAWIVVPPNTQYIDCYKQAEVAARKQQRGLWQELDYRPLPAAQLHAGVRGFHFVQGRVTHVGRSKKSLWLDFGKRFAVRIQNSDLPQFVDIDPSSLEGRTIIVRGWVYPYRQQSQIRVRHPAALQLVDH